MKGMKRGFAYAKTPRLPWGKTRGKKRYQTKGLAIFFNGYLLTEGLLDHVHAHVLAQRFGHGDGAVIVLIVF